jgi:thiol-disulfide isomerase/thioredoxin
MLDAATDEAVFLRDFTGKALRQPWKNKTRHVVVLSFWASWCEPCKEEIPILMKVADEFKGQPVKVFLVNTGENPTVTKDTVRSVIRRRGYTLPCLMDNTGTVARRYTVQSLPVLVVIDKFGVVRKVNWGYHQGFEQELRVLLPELIREAEEEMGAKPTGGQP